MGRKEEFDCAFRKLYENDGRFSYVTKGKDLIYLNYFSRDEFDQFRANMDEQLQKRFGKELSESESTPPKMASVASSSRLTYLYFRDEERRMSFLKTTLGGIAPNGNFVFEDDLPIKGVKDRNGNEICAHPDATYTVENRIIGVESKCHEPFDYHALEWSKQYLKNGLCEGTYSFGITEAKDKGGKVCVNPSVFGFQKGERRFLDVKQFVCHSIGLAAKGEKKKKDLIYLYFVPNGAETNFSDVYNNLKKQFKNLCNSKRVKEYCHKNDITPHLVFVLVSIKNGQEQFEIKENLSA